MRRVKTQKMYQLPSSEEERQEDPEEQFKRLYRTIRDDRRRIADLEAEVMRARAAADPKTLETLDGLVAEAARARRLEEEAQRLRSRLMVVQGGFDAARDAVIIAEPSGRVIMANHTADALFGELLGTDVKAAVLERVQEPIVRSSEDSAVHMMPMPYGYQLWDRVRNCESDRDYREGIEENVEILTVDNRQVDVKLSMHFVRDQNGHPLQLYLTVTNIEAAFRDNLTGLWARRTLGKVLDRKIGERERAVRDGREPAPLSVLIADIDHFKRVNDTRGHQAGDKAIRHVADMLARMFQRTTDLVARYGGEEFVVVMDLGTAEAYEAAEAFRRTAESSPVRSKELSEPFRVTVSIGMAEWRSGMGPQELIGEADRELYHSKNGGRNRTSTRMRKLTRPRDLFGIGS